MRPALLLDVDGVLCPFGGECPEGYARHEFGDGEWVYAARANGVRLSRLRKTFDLIWCTAWEHRANERLLDLHDLANPLPVIEFPHAEVFTKPEPRHRGHWKLPWIDDWAGYRPFVWFDDEIDADTTNWADRRSLTAATLALQIPFQTGLCDDHVVIAEEWWENTHQL